MKSTFPVVVRLAPSILLLAGCAHREPAKEATYAELPPPGQTSDHSTDRVYATTITAPHGAKGTIVHRSSSEDGNAQIALSVQSMVLSDPKIAPYPSKVTAAMDPGAKGKVILTGMVPTRAVKKNLVEHVRQIPGVTEVEDPLVLGVPKSSRETDFG